MITVYGNPGCLLCASIIADIAAHYPVRRVDVASQDDADRLLSRHPQVKCSTCTFGVALYVVEDEDGELVGADRVTIHRWLAEKKVKMAVDTSAKN